MIEIRKSDIYEARARSWSRLGSMAGQVGQLAGIFDQFFNAQAVEQYNKGATATSQIQEKWDAYKKQREYEVPVSTGEIETEPTPDMTGTVKKRFGEISMQDLEVAHDELVQSQIDWVNENITNKKAKKELIQAIQANSVDHMKETRAVWNEEAQREADASLTNFTKNVMERAIPWQKKYDLIEGRVYAMRDVGRMYPDAAEEYLQKVADAAQYAEASMGALAVMKASGAEAGEKWLDENTPYWNDTPDVRKKVLEDVRREWEYRGNEKDRLHDDLFSDLHIKAETIELCDEAIEKLKATDYHDDMKKEYWTRTLRNRKEYLENMQRVPPKNMDEYYKQNYNTAKWMIREKIAKGEITIEEAIRTVYKLMEGKDGPLLAGDKAAELIDYLERLQPEAVDRAADFLNSKGAGLSDEEKMIVGNKLDTLLKEDPTMTTKDIEDAVKNLTDPIIIRKLDQAFPLREMILPDTWNFSNTERMTEDIQTDKYTGLVKDREKELGRYNAKVLEHAQNKYPEHNIVSVYTDTLGETTGHKGTAVLVNRMAELYYFKMENKALVLYRYARQRNGTYKWEKVEAGSARTVTGPGF